MPGVVLDSVCGPALRVDPSATSQRDLRKKTLRGQIGQKERGFFVGERTFGYKSVPVGELRMDKKGRPRPEGYRMAIEPREAAVVLRAFREFADGIAIAKIVKRFNKEA